MHMTMVDIFTTFVCAEHTDNLQLHLEAVDHMISYFASSGQDNYAKCAHIYVQQICQLQHKHPTVYEALNNGHFTMIRQD